MSDMFVPKLSGLAPVAMPDFGPAPDVAQPAPAPVFNAPPIVVPPPLAKKVQGMVVSREAIRQAQSLYPREAQAKGAMMDRAAAAPTPTGAWGKPA